MLFLYLDKRVIKDSLITNIDKAFTDNATDLWFYNKYTADVVEAIDKATILPPRKMQHPIFGYCTPDHMSRYAKTMVLLKMLPDAVYRLSDLHCDMGSVLRDLSESQHVHLLCDCNFNFDEQQVVCLPELDSKIKGAMAINTVYNSYCKNTISAMRLTPSKNVKGEHVYV